MESSTFSPESAVEPIRLGDFLRPIALGQSNAELNAVGESAPPRLLVSVVSAEHDVLGYLAIDDIVNGSARGGLTSCSQARMHDAVLLARASTVQHRLCGVPTGAMHAVVTSGPQGLRARDRREFEKAIAPLVGAGVCDVAFEHRLGRIIPSLVHDATVASILTVATTFLARRGVELQHARVRALGRTALVDDVMIALTGLGVTPTEIPHADLDLLLVDGEPFVLEDRDVAQIDAGTIVFTGTVVATLAAERVLAERGADVIPGALATAGRSIFLHLLESDNDQSRVIARSVTRVRRLAESLIATAERHGEPIPDVIREMTRR